MRSKTRRTLYIVLAAIIGMSILHRNSIADTFRPPAVPLVVSDPYLSIWSEADHLTDDVTRHWTHHPHPLTSLIRIDNEFSRVMGPTPKELPALPQTSVEVLPTRTIYQFANEQVHVTLTFTTPVLPNALDILTRPITYITWKLNTVDSKTHNISLYFSAGGQLAVENVSQPVAWRTERFGPLTAMSVGTEEQPILQKSGDDMRIDWGYAYLATPSSQDTCLSAVDPKLALSYLATGKSGHLFGVPPPGPGTSQSEMALVMDLGRVGASPVSRHVMIGYDEIYSIKYFGKSLRPYWRRNGATPASLYQTAEREYPALMQRCEKFDRELMADLTKVGGEQYARIAALAYRQALGATGIAADAKGQPLVFTKENTSNGDIATVDVFYPMDPMLILLSPTLAKASLVPILDYAASKLWKFPNSPHDLGTYPIARGYEDGGEGMPVEESGNMILLCDAIAKDDGNASFVAPWWKQLTQWEVYLEKYGNDPEDQLCTDDFMGHLAHNANLSVKAILAIGAYADLCRMRGDVANADRIMGLAKGYAAHWVTVADDGGHSLLAFDKPHTWSQKYNLVWDKILGLNLFPQSVAANEITEYKSVMQEFGVPLDSRTKLTKTDWSVWSATLATKRSDFEAIISPIYNYLNTTSARQPLVDSYITNNVRSDGMHARPVVGGIFIKMLSDGAMWKKWSSRDKETVGPWAPLPSPPVITELVPTARVSPQIWSYTTTAPPAGWTAPQFDTFAWKSGSAGFGTAGTPTIVLHSVWNTDDIWLRREITVPNIPASGNLVFLAYHDEDIEIYVNGVKAASEGGYQVSYVPLEITPPALKLLRPGAKVTIAVHCHQTTGGQGVDVGLASVVGQP